MASREIDPWPERRLIPYETSVFVGRRVLVLAPHPDDEVFGCGAALADLLSRGARVRVVLWTDGAGETRDADTRTKIASERTAESRQALAILGLVETERDVVNAGFRDRELGSEPARLRGEISREVREFRPDIVFVPSPVEIHPDHRALAEAFIGATRSSPELRSATCAFFEVSQPIRPNLLFDATPFLAKKEEAMSAFASQLAGHDYKAFVRGLNAYRRMTLPREVAAAEAYHVLTGAEVAGYSLTRLRRVLGPSLGGEGGEDDPIEFWSFLAAFSPRLRS